MKRTTLTLALAGPLFWTALTSAQTSTPVKPGTSPSSTTTAKASSAKQPDLGGQKFDANCSRCHNAPEQLSPSLTGTVVRHMRVRANLSAQDEKDILRFLAP